MKKQPKKPEVESVTLSAGGKTVTIKGDPLKVLADAAKAVAPKDDMLPAQRMKDAIGKLQSALSALALAQEQLSIVDSQMLGCDENRRRVVESSKENPLDTANDIESHRSQAGQIKEAADLVAKAGKAIGGKAGFIAQALASVYKDELIAGDRERDKQAAKMKDGADPRQPPLFPEKTDND
jgi:hypothetical protein